MDAFHETLSHVIRQDPALTESKSKACVLSNVRIEEERNAGSLVIEPFNISQLNTSSYDVTLGSYYYIERTTGSEIDPFDADSLKNAWGGPYYAEDTIGILPGQSILAHTQEFIGGISAITTMMKARSSIGRCMLTVCNCAGWGDVGYINRWTMEITNRSQFHTVKLRVGTPVAQIIFMYTSPTNGLAYHKSGKYQSTSDLEVLKAEWSAECMLPRALSLPPVSEPARFSRSKWPS